jgi:hypothetical protein
MSENETGAAALTDPGVTDTEAELVETGNYPLPGDGPQDDLEQSTMPEFDEHLVDGAGTPTDGEVTQ